MYTLLMLIGELLMPSMVKFIKEYLPAHKPSVSLWDEAVHTVRTGFLPGQRVGCTKFTSLITKCYQYQVLVYNILQYLVCRVAESGHRQQKAFNTSQEPQHICYFRHFWGLTFSATLIVFVTKGCF